MVMGLANPFGLPFQMAALLLILCALLLGVFVLWETRTANPMLDMLLFKASIFSLGVSARSLSFVAAASILFLMPFFLQGVAGYSPGQTGMIMTSIAVGMVVVGPIAGRLSDKYGPRPFTVGGALISMSGLLILSQVSRDTPLPIIMLGILLQSSGMGMFTAPNASSILSGVSRSSYGVVSGFVQLIRTGSTVTGIAVATLIITAAMSAVGLSATLEGFSEGVSVEVGDAFTTGLQRVYLIMAGLQAGWPSYPSSEGGWEQRSTLSLIRGRIWEQRSTRRGSSGGGVGPPIRPFHCRPLPSLHRGVP